MLLRVTLHYDTNPRVLEGDSLLTDLTARSLATVTAVEALVNTAHSSLCGFTDLCPRLTKLKLNNSRIASVRDVGCRLYGLTYLSLAHCEIQSLNGISAISQNLSELHLAFNYITDVSDLMGMDQLQVLDLESNQITDFSNLRFLTCCTALTSLTLAGNPAVENAKSYAQIIRDILPNLVYLDERRVRSSKLAIEKRALRAGTQDRVQLAVLAKLHARGVQERTTTDAIDDEVNDPPPIARSQKPKKAISPSTSTIKIVKPVSAQSVRLSGK
jgi:hypothetical protein